MDDKNINDVENCLKKGDYFKALTVLKKLEKHNKNFLINWYLGHSYFKLHKYFNAIDHIKKFIKLKSKDPLNLNFLGELYLETNDHVQAKKMFENVLELDGDNKSARLNLAKINLNQGKVKESINIYKKLLEKDPLNYSYHYSLLKLDEQYLSAKLTEKIISDFSNLSVNNKIYSKLILAKKDEIEKKYLSETKNLTDAHKTYFELTQKAANQQFNFYTDFLLNFIEDKKQLNLKISSKFSPIFVMGLPRSGTTLVEKIIVSGENKIQSLGETDVFDKVFFSNQVIDNYKNKFTKSNLEFLQQEIVNQYRFQGLRENTINFTDKSISNFLYIEFISKIFPKAKFIYCYRNPVANIVGILRAFLPNIFWSHSLEKIFKMCDLYYKKLDKIKKDNSNNLHIVSLEELSSNPELISKKLYEYLDLKWSKKCLDKNDDLIFKTASNLQVRDKIKEHNLSHVPQFLKIFSDMGFDYKWLR